MITKEDCIVGTRVALITSKGVNSDKPFVKGCVAGEYYSNDNKETVIVRIDTGGVYEYYLNFLVLEKDILVEETLLKGQYLQANQAWEGMKPETIKRTKEATKLLQEVYNLMGIYKKRSYDLEEDDPLLVALEEARKASAKLIL